MKTLQLEQKREIIKEDNKLNVKNNDSLFRTLSRNHYNLLRMVDNKATFILTVNSILFPF